MATVSFEHVSKTFHGGIHAVRDFTLEVGSGELVALVGPSGCGKSTALRLLAGLEEADGGTISIDGRVVTDVAPKDRDIAMVFQSYALYPHMTVYDNMAFGLRRRKLPRAEIERRVAEAARILGIGDILKRKPGVLSGGQKQRVAVGRAIVREPKAFLFDEPLSNLDARQRLSTRAEIKALHLRLKATSIYVTHDQEEAMTLGDRVVVMQGGAIRQAGPPLEVYRRPVDRFVAGFIGTPPMNFLEGTIAAGPEGLLFEEGSPDAQGRARRLAVFPGHAGRMSAHVGRPLVLGLRPQALRESPGAGSPERVWELPVRVVEPLGDALDAYCLVGRTQVVARVAPGSRIESGGTARLAPDMEQAHYFEPGEFGRALLA